VVAVPEGSNAYNSLWQVRNDAWSRLEEATGQLALACSQQRALEPLTETVAAELELLGPIERFWAFPGMPAYQKVRRLFAAGKYDRCATVVARLNRALASDSYHGQAWDAGLDDDLYEADGRPADPARTDRRERRALLGERGRRRGQAREHRRDKQRDEKHGHLPREEAA